MPANNVFQAVAAYRIQLAPEFGFAEAAALAAYWSKLGVSHIYTSPFFEFCKENGYAITDFQKVSPRLGGEEGRTAFRQALLEQGLRELLDLVPNHMAADPQANAWWRDVLHQGARSPYAVYFDIDWEPPDPLLRGRILLPILDRHAGAALDEGALRLRRDQGTLSLAWAGQSLPLSPASLAGLLRQAVPSGKSELARLCDTLARQALQPAETEVDSKATREARDRLLDQAARLIVTDGELAAALDRLLESLNADPDRLEQVLGEQAYRLVYWRNGRHELNYRRFFDIPDLAGLQMERAVVFNETHARVREWIRDGLTDGLRIDHIDGLRDPQQYLDRVRNLLPEGWILVEKILGPSESLPAAWEVDGTTGYDFMNLAGGMLVDPAGEGPMTRLYQSFTGLAERYPDLLRAMKGLVLDSLFDSEMTRFSGRLLALARTRRQTRDLPLASLRAALREVLIRLPVYRTYVRPEHVSVEEEDARILVQAVHEARSARPELERDLFDFLEDLLLLALRGPGEEDVVLRLQQFSGSVMAKGAEDTAFYRYNRLASLNEVGGDPGQFGIDPAFFHAWCLAAQDRRPRGLLATATHDTKRGEDVRARLHLLSEQPEAWGHAVRRWAGLNERHRTRGRPDRNMEYLLYQTWVGAWPLTAERLKAYAVKAAREARQYTTWTEPDAGYEAALGDFIDGAAADPAFQADLEAFTAPLVRPGRINSLAQTLLKLTAPGVPDLYQGCELWDMSLVDPDNRRPVDYEKRRRLLEELDSLTPAAVLDRMEEGLPKLMLIRQALRARRRFPEAFGPEGSYRPLVALGPREDHVIAFSRGESVVSVAPRLGLRLEGGWAGTVIDLPPGRWRNCLTGHLVPENDTSVDGLLAAFPVALLTREG